MKEIEIRKVSSETQATAQVVRSTRNRVAVQTGGIRNTETTNVGSQTERPPTLDVGTQRNVKGVVTQTESPQTQIFDISMDTAMDDAMNDIEMEAAAQEEQINLQHERIRKKVGHN